MGEVFVVVLVAGMIIFASFYFRGRAYSHNQRIVLSGIAGVLLLWSGKDHIVKNPVLAVFYVGAVLLLIYAAMRLRKSG